MNANHRKRYEGNRRRSPPAAGETLRDLIVDMEEPLRDALGLVDVLYFIGLGLDALEDDAAAPLLALAGVQKRQLKTLVATWDALFAASGRT